MTRACRKLLYFYDLEYFRVISGIPLMLSLIHSFKLFTQYKNKHLYSIHHVLLIQLIQIMFQDSAETSSSMFFFSSSPLITITTRWSDGREQTTQTIPISTFFSTHDPPSGTLSASSGADGGGLSFQEAVATSIEAQILNRLIQDQQRHTPTHKATNKRQIAALPVYICEPQDIYQRQFGDHDKECTICLCESQKGDRLIALPCQHVFHFACLKPWLDSHNSCPTCRYELEMSDSTHDRERYKRMRKQYGDLTLQVMTYSSQIHKLYCDFQSWLLKSEQSRTLRSLNAIEKNCVIKLRELNAIVLPSSQRAQNKKYTWDWTRVYQVKFQGIKRAQMLLNLIDSARETVATKKQCCTIM